MTSTPFPANRESFKASETDPRGEDALKPAPFAYAKARSLNDAIRLIGEHKGEAKLLAGGQSLIATLNMRLPSPRC